MKSGVTTPLVNLLRSREPVLVVDLYEFTLSDGTVLRYTTADVPIPYGGHTFGTGILWERGTVHYVAGLQADSLQTTCLADMGDTINGLLYHDWLRQGGLDGAYLILRRAYYAYAVFYNVLTMSPVGALWLFSGQDPEVATGGLQAEITWKSPLYLLDRQMPRNLYQAPCGRVLYDAGCAVVKANYAVNAVAKAGSTAQVLQTILSQAAYPAGWFDLGWLTFTSGALAGETRTIKKYGGDSTLTLLPPLLAAPAVGATFTVWPGCDHTLATCQGKFAQAASGRAQPSEQYFGGEPWIPSPETAR